MKSLVVLLESLRSLPRKKPFSRSSQDGGEEEKEFDRVIVFAGGMAYPVARLARRAVCGTRTPGAYRTAKTPGPGAHPGQLGDSQPPSGGAPGYGGHIMEWVQLLATTAGNAIFTEWGLNGPAVMDISHYVTAFPLADLDLSLDLLALVREEFEHLLAQKRKTTLPLRVFLGAFFPPKVVTIYLKHAHLPEDILLERVSDRALEGWIEKLKNTRLRVKGVRGFEYCQISAGGVRVTEVDQHTLESRRVKRLFLTGETLDVVGPCGGYNLQFAFSSGAIAGKAAASRSGS